MDNLKSGESYTVFVTAVVLTDGNLTIWAQIDKNVEEAVAGISSVLENEAPCMQQLSDVVEGALCTCKFSEDQLWYRAVVENKVGQNKWLVRFMDYGNDQVLNENDIYCIPQQLCNIPGLATGLILDELVYPNKTAGLWTSSVVKFLQEAFLYQEIEVTISKSCRPKLYLAQSLQIYDLLISAKMAQNRMGSKYVVYPVGEKCKAYVSHMTNSGTFFIHNDEQSQLLGPMMDMLAAFYTSPHNRISVSKDSVSVGDLVAAFFSEDHSYYRAQVISIKEDSCVVYYFDYGNTEQQKYTTVFELDRQFFELNYQAIECELHNIEIFPEKYSENLRKCLCVPSNELIDIEVMEHVNAGSVKLSVLAFHDHKNLGSPLILQNFAKLKHSLSMFPYSYIDIQEGFQCSAVVSHVENGGVFFVSIMAEAAKLDQLMEDLKVYGDAAETLSKVAVDMPCLTEYNDDGSWYRGLILQCEKDVATIWYVDYGNTEIISVSMLKEIEPKFLRLKCQAIECLPLQKLGQQEVELLLSLSDQMVDVKFLKKNERVNSYFVTIVHDGKTLFLSSVNNSCEKKGVESFDSPRDFTRLSLEIDAVEEIFVTHFESTNHLWATLGSMNDAFCDMCSDMKKTYDGDSSKSFNVKRTLDLGSLCVVKDVAKGGWYRGKIVGLRIKQEYSVFLVDIGSTGHYFIDDLRNMEDKFMQLPMQAIRFCLALPGDCSMQNADKELLLSKVLSKSFFASVLELQSDTDTYVVELHDSNGNSIDSLLEQLSAHESGNGSNHAAVAEGAARPSLHRSSSSHENLVDVAVCFVEDPECMWIQKLSGSKQLYRLMDEMHSFYSGLPSSVLSFQQPQFDDLCAVKVTNGDLTNWYRGRILCLYADIVEVKLIDFGNEVKAKQKDIKALAPRFSHIEAQALKCKLFNVRPALKRWTNDAIRELCRLTRQEANVSAKFLEKQRLSYVVDLFIDDQNEKVSVSEHLVKLQFASWESDLLVGESAANGTNANLMNEYPSKTNSKRRLLFQSPGVALVGAEIDVSPSQMTSPDDFFLKLADPGYSEKYAKLLAELNATCSSANEESLSLTRQDLYIGKPCCAYYDKIGQWCRGAVLNFSDLNNLKISLVDFGFVIIARLQDIKAIKDNFVLKVPAAALRCTVRGIISPANGDWNSDAIDLCRNFLEQNQQQLSCTVHGCAGNGMSTYFICSVRSPLCNLGDKLVDAGFAIKPRVMGQLMAPMRLKSFIYSNLDLVKGKEDLFYITHIESPDLFFCQLPSQFNQFDGMMDNLQEYCKQIDQGIVASEQLAQDCVCFARFGDNWGRAHCVSLEANRCVKVLFVDYGNTETVELKDVRPVGNNGKFFELPIQALPCSLGDLELFSGTPAQYNEVLALMHGLLYEKQLGGVVTGSSNGKLHLDLFSDNKRINDTIIKEAKLNVRPPNVDIQSFPSPEEPCTYKTELSQPFFLRVGVVEKVSLSHCHDPRNFYLCFNKLDEEKVTCEAAVDGFYTAMRNADYVVHNLSAGDTVCARQLTDMKWYRATVLSTSGDTVHVHFVDTGKTGRVNKSVDVKQLVNKMDKWPVMAIPCSLAGVAPADHAKWTNEATLVFQSLCCAEELIARFLHKDDRSGIWLVSLSVGDEDLAFHLLNKNLAEQDKEECEAFNIGFSEHAEVEIAVGGLWQGQKPVFISHVLSCSEVYLQLVVKCSELEELMAKMNVNEQLQMLTVVPKTDSFCLALYDEDNQFYRAVVISDQDEGSCEVRFVDYGNTAIVDVKDLRQLDGKHAVAPQFALYCKLKFVPQCVPPKKIVAKLNDLSVAEDVVLLASFLPTCGGDDNVVEINVVQSGKTFPLHSMIADLDDSDQDAKVSSQAKNDLVTSELQFYTTMENIMEKTNRKVYISHVENPGHVFCQFSEYCDELDTLMDSIENYYKVDRDEDKLLSVNSLPVGSPCVAKYHEDNTWYRAVLKEVRGDMLAVTFVDYGNTECIALKDIKKSKIGFCILPALAVQCYVALVDHNPSSWSQNDTAKFESRVTNIELRATFSRLIDFDEKIFEVMLRLPQGKLLNNDYIKTPETNTVDAKNVDEVSAASHDEDSEQPMVDEKDGFVSAIRCDKSHVENSLTQSPELMQEVVVVHSLVIEEGLERECFVSYGVSPQKFYVQFSDADDELDRILTSVAADAENLNCVISSSISVGCYCISLSPDDSVWYRGKVSEVGEQATVFFLDYGNSSQVDWEAVKPMSKQVAEMAIQAIPCYLAGFNDIHEDSKKAAEDTFFELVLDNAVIVKFQKQLAGGDWEVSLTANGVDVGKKVLSSIDESHRKAFAAAMNEGAVELEEQQTDVCPTSLLKPGDEQFNPSAISTPAPNIVIDVADIQSNNPKDAQLAASCNASEISAYVPPKQPSKSEDILNFVSTVFSEIKESLLHSSPYDKVVEKIDKAMSEIKNIHASAGKLASIDDHKRAASSMFVNLSPSKKPRLEKPLPYSGTPIIYESITEQNEKTSEEESFEEMHIGGLPCQVFQADDVQEVSVMCVESPNCFYVKPHTVCDHPCLLELEDSCKKMEAIENDSLCAFRTSEEESFKRGVILNCNGDELVVMDVDSGFKYTLTPDDVFELPDAYKSYSPLAVCCALYGVAPVGSEWSEEACLFFNELLQNPSDCTTCRVEFIQQCRQQPESYKWFVNIIVNEKSLTEHLINENFSLPKKESECNQTYVKVKSSIETVQHQHSEAENVDSSSVSEILTNSVTPHVELINVDSSSLLTTSCNVPESTTSISNMSDSVFAVDDDRNSQMICNSEKDELPKHAPFEVYCSSSATPLDDDRRLPTFVSPVKARKSKQQQPVGKENETPCESATFAWVDDDSSETRKNQMLNKEDERKANGVSFSEVHELKSVPVVEWSTPEKEIDGVLFRAEILTDDFTFEDCTPPTVETEADHRLASFMSFHSPSDANEEPSFDRVEANKNLPTFENNASVCLDLNLQGNTAENTKPLDEEKNLELPENLSKGNSEEEEKLQQEIAVSDNDNMMPIADGPDDDDALSHESFQSLPGDPQPTVIFNNAVETCEDNMVKTEHEEAQQIVSNVPKDVHTDETEDTVVLDGGVKANDNCDVTTVIKSPAESVVHKVEAIQQSNVSFETTSAVVSPADENMATHDQEATSDVTVEEFTDEPTLASMDEGVLVTDEEDKFEECMEKLDHVEALPSNVGHSSIQDENAVADDTLPTDEEDIFEECNQVSDLVSAIRVDQRKTDETEAATLCKTTTSVEVPSIGIPETTDVNAGFVENCNVDADLRKIIQSTQNEDITSLPTSVKDDEKGAVSVSNANEEEDLPDMDNALIEQQTASKDRDTKEPSETAAKIKDLDNLFQAVEDDDKSAITNAENNLKLEAVVEFKEEHSKEDVGRIEKDMSSGAENNISTPQECSATEAQADMAIIDDYQLTEIMASGDGENCKDVPIVLEDEICGDKVESEGADNVLQTDKVLENDSDAALPEDTNETSEQLPAAEPVYDNTDTLIASDEALPENFFANEGSEEDNVLQTDKALETDSDDALPEDTSETSEQFPAIEPEYDNTDTLIANEKSEEDNVLRTDKALENNSDDALPEDTSETSEQFPATEPVHDNTDTLIASDDALLGNFSATYESSSKDNLTESPDAELVSVKPTTSGSLSSEQTEQCARTPDAAEDEVYLDKSPKIRLERMDSKEELVGDVTEVVLIQDASSRSDDVDAPPCSLTIDEDDKYCFMAASSEADTQAEPTVQDHCMSEKLCSDDEDAQ